MINLTIQSTIQSTIKNTLGNLSEKFITQLFVPVGSDSFITADNKIFKVRVDMSTLLYLFAEDQRGVWYDPSDLATMYQESTGTTPVTADGQPVGLMLDKSRGDALGDELIQEGYTPKNLNISLYSLSNVQDGSFGQGALYEISITIVDYIGGDLRFQFYDTGSNSLIYSKQLAPSNGLFNFRFFSIDSFDRIRFQAAGSGFAGTVDNISVKEVLGTTATQPVATKRPTYKETPDRLEIDLVDDALLFEVPTGGIDGYMVIGTNDGTASYGVSLPAGSYELGGDYFPSNTINGFLLREGSVSQADLAKVEKDFVSKGAKASYGDVTIFSGYWRNKNITEFPLVDTSNGFNFYATWRDNNLTSFPLIDTSSGTNFGNAWFGNNLTSFPLIDVSKGTDFNYAWYDNNLTSFPLLDTSSGTNFSGAWRKNNLTSFPLIDTSNGTNFSLTWRDNNLTSFPLIDTSNGTSFEQSWFNNSLTSFPLIDTSNGTSFALAWYSNPTLANFPANMFDNCLCTNFSNAFFNTGLTQTSIDGILVSIESNGTSNGTFNQSGGSAPSSTGEAAIDALRSRGWTITVTGGY